LSSINFLKKKNINLKIGVLGCMAERLKEKFLIEEKIVDLVVGPDAYRDIPNLLKQVEFGNDAVNVLLSKEETYSDINPQRLNSNGISAFVSITRGCDNMCTFCVVPFTRGRERSRDPKSILNEIKKLYENGYKEITLLGQNVDSYLWYGGGLKKDFKKASEIQKRTSINFAKLLDLVAKSYPNIRIRFTTSNPQDMDIEVLSTMQAHKNICNHIHLPVQSGSNIVLKAMNRQHTREEYLNLISSIKKILPNCGISQDMITGFPNETEKDHLETLSLMELVKYDFGFMFKYSERPGTLAARKMKDNIPEQIKQRRLSEIIDLQFRHSFENLSKYKNKTTEVLIEKESKKSNSFWSGRNEQNIMVVMPKQDYIPGDFVEVSINDNTSTTLIGNIKKKIK
jgi:tRNA-2-methylthio-N6-dimethylallyladenosine synthase